MDLLLYSKKLGVFFIVQSILFRSKVTPRPLIVLKLFSFYGYVFLRLVEFLHLCANTKGYTIVWPFHSIVRILDQVFALSEFRNNLPTLSVRLTFPIRKQLPNRETVSRSGNVLIHFYRAQNRRFEGKADRGAISLGFQLHLVKLRQTNDGGILS